MADTDLRALLAPRVEAGAKLLDERRPGWADRIDLDTFDMASGCDCVLGQEYADVELEQTGFHLAYFALDLNAHSAADLGFTSGGEGDYFYNTLDRLWAEQIRARRAEAVTS